MMPDTGSGDRRVWAVALLVLASLSCTNAAVIKGLNTGANDYVFLRQGKGPPSHEDGPETTFLKPYVAFPANKLRVASEGGFMAHTKDEDYVCTSLSGPTCWQRAKSGKLIGSGSSGQVGDAMSELVTLVTSAEEFEEISQGFRGDWVVLFYHGRCRTCVHARAMLDEAARRLQGHASVALVDCESAQALQLCQAQGVSTLPDMRMIVARPDADRTSQVRWEGLPGPDKAGPQHKFTVNNICRFAHESRHLGRSQPETPPKGDFVSQTSQKKQEVVFENKRLYSCNLYWVDFMGREQHYHYLTPGTVAHSTSYAGHVWVARDAATKELLAEFVVEDEKPGVKHRGFVQRKNPHDPLYVWMDDGGKGPSNPIETGEGELGIGGAGMGLGFVATDDAAIRSAMAPLMDKIQGILQEGGVSVGDVEVVDVEMSELMDEKYTDLQEVDVKELAMHMRRAIAKKAAKGSSGGRREPQGPGSKEEADDEEEDDEDEDEGPYPRSAGM